MVYSVNSSNSDKTVADNYLDKRDKKNNSSAPSSYKNVDKLAQQANRQANRRQQKQQLENSDPGKAPGKQIKSASISAENNVARLLVEQAMRQPESPAMILPGQAPIKFGHLLAHAAMWQKELLLSYKPGDRIVLLVLPGIELYSLLLAILASGMSVVFIDPSMGKLKMLRAIKRSKAKAIISYQRLLKYKIFVPDLWMIDCISIDQSPWSKLTPADDKQQPAIVPVAREFSALISWTSGTTGNPKGAIRQHLHLQAQHMALHNHWHEHPGEVVLSGMPVMALHFMVCGCCTLPPDIDLSNPQADAEKVVRQIREHRVRRIISFPALLERLAKTLEAQNTVIPGVAYIGIGGSPVSQKLCMRLEKVFPLARVEVVYGSTEAEPIAFVTASDWLSEFPSQGYLVGRPVSETLLAIVPTETQLKSGEQVLQASLGTNQLGEILVCGRHVLNGYLNDVKATAENKLFCDNGFCWHKTGDTGYLDARGRLWLTGREKQRVFSDGRMVDVYPIESEAENLPGIARAILVQQSARKYPLMVLESENKNIPQASISLLEQLLIRTGFADARVLVHPSIPMDSRHHSKVDRKAILQWSKTHPKR
ncbi:AMP-binding protein [Pelagibaculum spongiae]|uniref:AMP-dependent synthetase/ligase domain-containing protein n=1 Tax=Pelagibaculum spongiae TaxID=2080658 RepID=A0A2V1H3A8_9GAMM|nr:AMP-binding protein [Pelagibaculum spongiae]PVZ72460.1 hypothetical protein DC094_05505 [Pelagibaculum spongiae]